MASGIISDVKDVLQDYDKYPANRDFWELMEHVLGMYFFVNMGNYGKL